MANDTLYPWEKWPLIAAFAAQGTYVFRWYLGDQAVPEQVTWLLPIIHTAGGVAAAVSIEGAMIATMMGVRMGRRGRYSTWALIVTAVFGAAVALNLYGALGGEVGAWLHAGFALTIVSYLLHLTQPIEQPATTAPQPDELPTPTPATPQAPQLTDNASKSEPAWLAAARRYSAQGMSARKIAEQDDIDASAATVSRWLREN